MSAFVYQSLMEYAKDLSDELDTIEDPEPETLAYILDAIRNLRADLATIYDGVERNLIAAMGDTKRFTVEGLGEIERKTSNKRTEWDNQGVTAVVVARALDERKLDEQTGEYESEASAVSRVLSDCARPSWRVTALKARGIDPDEFCHTEWGGPSIALPPRQR